VLYVTVKDRSHQKGLGKGAQRDEVVECDNYKRLIGGIMVTTKSGHQKIEGKFLLFEGAHLGLCPHCLDHSRDGNEIHCENASSVVMG